MTEKSRTLSKSRLQVVACLSGMGILAACASTPPPPTASLTAAHSAITDAEKADAGRYASPELAEARDKLAAANVAVEQKQMPDAERLANEARVEADLASARTGQAKAAAVNADMQHSNDVLTEELQRKSGAQ